MLVLTVEGVGREGCAGDGREAIALRSSGGGFMPAKISIWKRRGSVIICGYIVDSQLVFVYESSSEVGKEE